MDVLVEQHYTISLNEDLKKKDIDFLCVAFQKSYLHIIVGDEVEDNLLCSHFGKQQK